MPLPADVIAACRGALLCAVLLSCGERAVPVRAIDPPTRPAVIWHHPAATFADDVGDPLVPMSRIGRDEIPEPPDAVREAYRRHWGEPRFPDSAQFRHPSAPVEVWVGQRGGGATATASVAYVDVGEVSDADRRAFVERLPAGMTAKAADRIAEVGDERAGLVVMRTIEMSRMSTRDQKTWRVDVYRMPVWLERELYAP